MRRVMCFVLVMLILIGLFSGCAPDSKLPKDTTSKGTEKETVNNSEDNKAHKIDLSYFTGKVETVNLIDEIIAQYNAQSDGITVEQEYQENASNIIKIKFASGESPDVMTTYEQEYVDQKKYMDLSKMNQWWDRLIPSMRTSCTDLTTGKQFRVCTNMTMAGFFYNKEVFEELNLSVALNWDEFVSNLTKIKEKHPEMVPWFIFGSEAWHLGHLIEFLPHGYIKAKYGATKAKEAMLKNDNSILNWGDPNGAMCTFAKNLIDLQEKQLINSDVLTATSDNCVDAFVTGKCAMLSNGMWCLSGILEKNPDMAKKIGFAPYPSFMNDGVPVVLVAEDSGYCISADTTHVDAAVDFLNYLFSAENQKKYSETLGSPSAFKDVDAKWAPDSIVQGVNDAVEKVANIGFTNEKPAGFSGDDAGRLVQDLLAGTYTAEAFAKAYENNWNAGFSSTN